MRWLPPLRWFQFRLSTWFVLVGILAWTFSVLPPYYRVFGPSMRLSESSVAPPNAQVC
jgi:hypothetical protein